MSYTYTYQEMKDAALAAANEARAFLGFDSVDHLYKGKRVTASYCPITNTVYDDDVDRLTVGIGTTQDYISVWEKVGAMDRELVEINLTEAATDFVYAFDTGRFPELEIDE